MNAQEAIKLATIIDRVRELSEAIDAPLECEVGKRFIRLVTGDVSDIPLRAGGFALVHRSVHAFVDITNGDIIKSAGWKAPQKGVNGLAVRGNLLDDQDFARILKVADKYGSYLYQR